MTIPKEEEKEEKTGLAVLFTHSQNDTGGSSIDLNNTNNTNLNAGKKTRKTESDEQRLAAAAAVMDKEASRDKDCDDDYLETVTTSKTKSPPGKDGNENGDDDKDDGNDSVNPLWHVRRQHEEEQAQQPGAYRVGNSRAYDSQDSDIQSVTASPNPQINEENNGGSKTTAEPRLIEAVLVKVHDAIVQPVEDDDDDEEKARPRNDLPNRPGRFWVLVALGVILLVILIVIVVLLTMPNIGFQEGKNDNQITNAPTSSPTQEPTPPPPRQWIPMGQALMGENAGDEFGYFARLSADGMLLAVSEDEYDLPGVGADAGAVRVFRFNVDEGTWEQVGQRITGIDARDQFGWNPCLGSNNQTQNGNGELILAAASSARNTNTGIVLVFRFNDSSQEWEPMGEPPMGEAEWDYFGSSLDLASDGLILAAGSPLASNNATGDMEIGSVRAFAYNRTTDTWEQLGQTIMGDDENDFWGAAVALSSDGTTLAASAPFHDLDVAEDDDAGQVRIFRYDSPSNQWLQIGEDFLGDGAGDALAYEPSTLALSDDGNIVAIASSDAPAEPTEDGSPLNAGLVRVYRFNGTGFEWQQLGQDLRGDNGGDWFGFAIALSADGFTVGVGSPLHDGVNEDSGTAKVFRYDAVEDQWEQVGETLVGLMPEDHAGISIGLSGDGDSIATFQRYRSSDGKDSGQVQVYRKKEE